MRWTPYIVGVLAVIGSVLFWRALDAQQDANVARIVRAAVPSIQAHLHGHIQSLIRGLEGLAASEILRQRSVEEWRTDARLVLKKFPGVRAIEWIDLDRTVREMEPAPAMQGDLPRLAVPTDEPQRRVMEAAYVSRVAGVTAPLRLPDGRVGFRVVVPVFPAGHFDGFISAQVGEEFISAALVDEGPEYTMVLVAEDTELYRRTDSTWTQTEGWRAQREIQFPPATTWTLVVGPSAALLAAINSGVPEIVLAAGLLIAVLLAVTLHFAGTATLQARQLTATNRQLGAEIEQRRHAEGELRELAGVLELRVQERTSELASANSALRMENELRQRAQLRVDRSNDDLRQFTAFVSHELRQPLAAMQIWGQLLRSSFGEQLGEQGSAYLTKLETSIHRMTKLIEGELKLSQVAYSQMEAKSIDIAATLNEVIADCRAELDRTGGRVEIGELPAVQTDPTQLGQLFRNLIENAIKYRRPDVPLVIRIHGGQSATAEGMCDVFVEDNGRGFEPAEGDELFEIFRRSADAGIEGLGIGLAICRRIVERHGGSISAAGRPGVGATFHVVLPCATGDTLQVAAS